ATAAEGFASERIVGKAGKKAGDGNARLESRHVEPGAHVRSRAEGEVPVGRARNIEPVGIGKFGRVAVGGADAQGDEAAGGHGNAADVQGGGGQAVAKLIGAF